MTAKQNGKHRQKENLTSRRGRREKRFPFRRLALQFISVVFFTVKYHECAMVGIYDYKENI